MEIAARPHARALVRWAASRPRVLVLSADLTSSCEVNDFRDAYPERFISGGMTEQNLIGMAAGLAREGWLPFFHTFAVFITRRAFDQVAMSVAYPHLPVRLVGFLPGLTTPGGVTHQAIDDVGLMRLLPNMTIVEPGDATEVESVLEATEQVGGPLYLRMPRGEVPRLFPVSQPLVLGRCRELGEGRDLLVLSSGACTEEALRALTLLRGRGCSIRHLHVSTLKPFADPLIAEACRSAWRGVITIENHLVTGGLGTAVAELMAEAGIGLPLRRLGLTDTYAHGASKRHLFAEYGLDAWALVQAVQCLLGTRLAISRADLSVVRLEPVHSRATAEAL